VRATALALVALALAPTRGHAQEAPASQAPAEPSVDASAPGLFESSVQAAEPSTQAGVARALSLNGYARGDVFIGGRPGTHAPEIKAAYGELALRLKASAGDAGEAFGELRVRSLHGGPRAATSVDLREAYLNVYWGPLDLRVGNQVIVWGRADAFNPTNNLTPFDLNVRSPVEDDRRVGNWALRSWLSFAPLRLELVWVPVYAAAELPPVEPAEYVTLVAPDFPAPRLSNGLGAARLHFELADLEASVSYLRGHAPLPGLALEGFTVGVDPPEVRVTRRAYVQDVVGADFSTALGELLAVRGEVAYRHPTTREVQAPSPDLQYVLGVDRAFGPLSLIVQYLGRYVFDWRAENGPERPVDPQELVDFDPDAVSGFLEQTIVSSIEAELAARNQLLFSQSARVQHLASVRAEWLLLHETLSLSALGLVNFTTEEWLLYPKLGYRVNDWLSAYLGAEVYAGPRDSLFGLIDEILSAGYAELRLGF
jgi:hypothetical protein